jgi:hypothetical protein
MHFLNMKKVYKVEKQELTFYIIKKGSFLSLWGELHLLETL